MADFVQTNNSEQSGSAQQAQQSLPVENNNMCVVAIVGDSIYDTSEFANASKDFLYTTLKYSDIPNFYKMLIGITRTTEFKYLNILRYFSIPDSKIFFDFKCSSDCCSGARFTNEELTKKANQLIKLLLKKKANVVVGDHSMGALFNNWDPVHMGPCPISIKKETTFGLFKMYGESKNFLESVHPTLNQLGDISDNNKVEITFTNMGGTLIYSINTNTEIPVKLISQGYPLNYQTMNTGDPDNPINNNIYIQRLTQPVHCEFPLFNGNIIVSSTHWCNLHEIRSDINEDKLKSNYTRAFGRDVSARMEEDLERLKSNSTPQEVREYCSARVKDICSGDTQFE